jgi:hypothetical protein
MFRPPANLGFRVAALGGAVVLAAFPSLPVLVSGTGGPRTGRQIAASAGHLWVLGLLWLLSAVAVALMLAGVLRMPAASIPRRAAGGMVATGLAALGHVVALMLLQHPQGATAAYAAGIDPAGAVGPGYWLSLAGFVIALAGFVIALAGVVPYVVRRPGEPSVPARPARPVATSAVAGIAAGVAIGTVVASVVLGMRQHEIGRGVVPLAVDVLGDTAMGPNFAAAPAVQMSALGTGGEVAGDSEQLYGGTPGQSSCDRAAIAAFVAAAGSARSGAWTFAVSRDVPQPPLTDIQRYITELTPVQLRADTRVTAHRFAGDQVLPVQATLQAGSAVLVDARGIPRVRCAGAIPLGPPRATDEPEHLDPRWPGFDPAALVTVTPAPAGVREFGLVSDGQPFRRPAGTDGSADVPAQAFLDGTYTLDGTQATCNVTDCDKLMTRSLTVTVTGCPDECRVAGDEWDGTVALTPSSGSWSASGASTKRFGCNGTADPTSFAVTLRVTEWQVFDGRWVAERLDGTYRKDSTADTMCRASELSWSMSGTRQ